MDEVAVATTLDEPLVEGVEDLLRRKQVGDLVVDDIEDGVADPVAVHGGVVDRQQMKAAVIVVVAVAGGGRALRGTVHVAGGKRAQLLLDPGLERQGEAHGARQAGEGLGRIVARAGDGPGRSPGAGVGARRCLGVIRRLQRATGEVPRQGHAELAQLPQHGQPLLGAVDAGVGSGGGGGWEARRAVAG